MSKVSWWSRRKGVVIAIVAIALIALLGMAALTIDVGRLVVAKQCLQDAADAAALAAVGKLREGMDPEAGAQVAIQVAAGNQVLTQPVILDPDVDVQVGAWDTETEQIVPWSPAFTLMAVQVTARATEDSPNGPIPMTFARIFGIDSVEMTASAAASVRAAPGVRDIVEIITIQDASGSFQEEWQDAINADFALVNLVKEVARDEDRVGFVAFDEDIAVKYEWHWSGWYWEAIPLTLELTGLTGHDSAYDGVQQTYDLASSYSPNGYTNPGIALEWAIDEYLAHGSSDNKQAIVLVSDGMPFGGDEETTQQYRDFATAQADRAESLGIRIHTVTLTSEEHGEYGYGGADFEFNESLCCNGGYAFRTHDPDKLRSLLITIGDIELGHARLFR